MVDDGTVFEIGRCFVLTMPLTWARCKRSLTCGALNASSRVVCLFNIDSQPVGDFSAGKANQ